jgi:hypothetical protein
MRRRPNSFAIAIEKHDRLAERKAVLRTAERQHVHAGAPRDVGRRAIERSDCIGKPCAIDVHRHTVLVRAFGQVPHFQWRIKRPELGRLRQREHMRPRRVHVMRRHCQLVDRLRRQFGQRRIRGEELGASAEESRRAAFVDVDVRHCMADDRVRIAAHRREAERISGRAGEHEKDFAVGFEEITDRGRCSRGPVVATVGRCVTRIGRGQRSPGLGADAGPVVAGELRVQSRGHDHWTPAL